MRHFSLTASILAALLLGGCGNECSFFEQCDGSVLQVCGDGPDQMFGRQIHETACEGDNPVCIEIDDQAAMCAAEDAQACDPDTYAATCEGDLLRTCSGVLYTEPVDYPTAYEVVVDCAAEGMSCDAEAGACI